MAKRTMNEQQILDMICGATLLGGGGGGSMQDGLDLLIKYKESHKEPPMVTVWDTSEMKEGEYAAITAGMGAPTAIKNVDFSAFAANAFMALQEMAGKMTPPKPLKYSMAVEMGGFNTFVPMMISLVNGIPFLDADGSGRAVPALDTLLLHINGCDTSPLAMANGNNDKVTIVTTDPKDAHMAEEIGRHICMSFGMIGGLSGWMLDKTEIDRNIPTGTVTLAENVGRVFRECIAAGKTSEIFETLASQKVLNCKPVCKGKVVKFDTIMEKGFDRGEVTISGGKETWVIDFQNENLMVSKLEGGKKIPYMTVPDIICMYDTDTGMPFTNADVKEGLNVALGVVEVDSKWWNNTKMFDVWKPFLDRVGYAGGNLPYEKL